MTVACSSQLLLLLRGEKRSFKGLAINDAESTKLNQRVSELMAVDSLLDFSFHPGGNLQEVSAMPSRQFSTTILTPLNLVFVPNENDENRSEALSSVKSIELVGLAR